MKTGVEVVKQRVESGWVVDVCVVVVAGGQCQASQVCSIRRKRGDSLLGLRAPGERIRTFPDSQLSAAG